MRIIGLILLLLTISGSSFAELNFDEMELNIDSIIDKCGLSVINDKGNYSLLPRYDFSPELSGSDSVIEGPIKSSGIAREKKPKR